MVSTHSDQQTHHGEERLPKRDDRIITVKLVSETAKPEEPKTAKSKDWWDKVEIIGGFLMPLVLAGAAYFATTRADVYLKERQFEMTSAKEMSQALTDLLNAGNEQEADRKARILASYGVEAITPLFIALQDPNPHRAQASKKQLLLLAGSSETANELLCKRLTHYFLDGARIHKVATHLHALHIIAHGKCSASTESINRYDTKLKEVRRNWTKDDDKKNEAAAKILFHSSDEVHTSKLEEVEAAMAQVTKALKRSYAQKFTSDQQ